MQTKTECSRCGVEIDEDDNYSKDEQDYCENCYDDLFVSYQEAYERVNVCQ